MMQKPAFLYDKDYYEQGKKLKKSMYTNYHWLPEFTIPFCARVIEYLNITEGASILDFGCAKGFYVKGFRLLYRNAWGVDVSPYAINSAPTDIKPYVSLVSNIDEIKEFHHYDWVMAKDVFEHIPYHEIGKLLTNLRSISRSMFIIVPLGDGKKFISPLEEFDVTHIIRENIEWWMERFKVANFSVMHHSYKVKHMKQNWSTVDKGHGFFILK